MDCAGLHFSLLMSDTTQRAYGSRYEWAGAEPKLGRRRILANAPPKGTRSEPPGQPALTPIASLRVPYTVCELGNRDPCTLSNSGTRLTTAESVEAPTYVA